MLNTKIHSSYNYDTFVENVKMNLGSIHEWVDKNEMKPHSGKTKVMFIESLHNLNTQVWNRPVGVNEKPVVQVVHLSV